MMKSMKNMLLIAAMVASMVASFAAPVMAAANDELQTTKRVTEGPTVSDHSDGSSNDGSGSPAAEEAVKDSGISRCDVTPSGCQGTNDQEGPASHDGASAPFVCIKAPCGEDSEDSATPDPTNAPVVCIKAPCGDTSSSDEDDPTNVPFVCIKAPCGSSSAEEDDRVKDAGIRPCDIAPPGCQNTEEDSAHTSPLSTSSEKVGQSANSSSSGQQSANSEANSSPTVYGCPFDYDYSERFHTCLPPYEEMSIMAMINGDKPLPDSFGGYVALPVDYAHDLLTGTGLAVQMGLGQYVEDALVEFGEDGGPIGYGIQGLGYTIGFAGDTAGVLLEGAGEAVSAVADGVGEVVDTVVDNVVNPVLVGVGEGVEGVVEGVEKVADVATSAWKKISSWF